MSALNVYLAPDQIQVWTDGALYDADGTLLSVNTKVAPLPHLNAVVALRGPGLALPLLAHHLGTFPSFDALIAELVPAIQEAWTVHESIFDMCSHGPDFELVVAGWSGQHGCPEAYAWKSAEPLIVHKLGPVTIAPGAEVISQLMRAEFPALSDSSDLSDQAIWRRLMELQRETIRLEQVEGAGAICAVGAFCQLTTITSSRTTTEIVRRWPDRVGEKMGG